MQTLWKVLIGILIVGFLSFVALYILAPKPVVVMFHNYSEAFSGDPAKDHWLPDFLPKSAKNIYMQHGVDPTFLLLEFSFDSADKREMTRNFTQLSDSEAISKAGQQLSKRRWKTDIPKDIVIFVPSEYKGDSESPYLIVDGSQGRAWYTDARQ